MSYCRADHFQCHNAGAAFLHILPTLWENFGSVIGHMASKTPSHPARRRRSPTTRSRATSRSKNTTARRQRTKKSQRNRATSRRGGPSRAARRKSPQPRNGNARFSLPKPPPPEQVIAVVREELDRLSARWKTLLPRLKKSGTNGSTRSRKRTRK
jgi:hypothetical protein